MNQLCVLGCLIDGGNMTTSEIVDRYVMPASYERNVAMINVLQRLKALSRDGCVSRIGEVPCRGGKTILWEATEYGRRYYECSKDVNA